MRAVPARFLTPFWIGGVASAITGVCIARLLAPLVSQPTRGILVTSGRTLALAGIFIIAFGIHRRMHAPKVSDAKPAGALASKS